MLHQIQELIGYTTALIRLAAMTECEEGAYEAKVDVRAYSDGVIDAVRDALDTQGYVNFLDGHNLIVKW